MSLRVSKYVWEHSKQQGSARLLLLAIADHAHDDGNGAYPGISKLAKWTLLSPRQVIRLLSKLEASGELIIERGKAPYGGNVYRIALASDMYVTSDMGVTSDTGDTQLVTSRASTSDIQGDAYKEIRTTKEPSINRPKKSGGNSDNNFIRSSGNGLGAYGRVIGG